MVDHLPLTTETPPVHGVSSLDYTVIKGEVVMTGNTFEVHHVNENHFLHHLALRPFRQKMLSMVVVNTVLTEQNLTEQSRQENAGLMMQCYDIRNYTTVDTVNPTLGKFVNNNQSKLPFIERNK
jgi:hypothetical protein